mgnify:CR=1 FL=1
MSEKLMKLVKELESLRRDKSHTETGPLSREMQRDLESATGSQMDDYAWYLNLVSAGHTALEEALPNGQLRRASLAMVLLQEGTRGLKTWMQVRGYMPDLETLALFEDEPAVEEEQVVIRQSVFGKGNGELLTTSNAHLTRNGETLVARAVVKLREDKDEIVYRLVSTDYNLIKYDGGFKFAVENSGWCNYVYSKPKEKATAIVQVGTKEWEPSSEQLNAAAKEFVELPLAQPPEEFKKLPELQKGEFYGYKSAIMREDRYYIADESLELRETNGFQDIVSALDWVRDHRIRDVQVPRYLPAEHRWDVGGGFANTVIIYGADLKDSISTL